MKKYGNLGFFVLFIIYLEIVFRIYLFKDIINISLIQMILFAIPISLVLFLITSLFNNHINKIITYISTIFIALVFIAQIIYYNIYEAIFSIYSMGNGGQVFEFLDTILKEIFDNLLGIILLLIPVLVLFIFNKKIFNYKRIHFRHFVVFILLAIVFEAAAYGSLLIDEEEDYSSKKLYFDINSPTLSANKLGLMTTMRIDLERMIIGFSEKSRLSNQIKADDEDISEQIDLYNKIDIDFDKLISLENDDVVKELHAYFKNETATSKNKYTGMFKGKNLIYVLAESFYPIAIDKKLTPTLYKLYSSGFNFTNFYTPIYPVSTSDGEYITATSLIPKEGVWSSKVSSNNYFPYVLGNAFKNAGYQALAYHDHKGTYYNRDQYIPNWGYTYKACKLGLNINCSQWPESDLEMVEATYKDFVSKEPFLTYYITVSGHLNYTRIGNSMVAKNWSYVKDLPYSDKVKGYIACNIELDKALEKLIKHLEEAKTLDNTVIALSSDHYPYGLTLDEINEISPYKRDNDFEKHHTNFLLWNNKTDPIQINKIGSSLDILPTLFNLFGIEYDSRILMGKDLLSNEEPLVIFSNRSWITNKGKYNSLTKEFIPFDNNKKDDGYIKKINEEIYNKFYLSKKIIETDYYRKLFNK